MLRKVKEYIKKILVISLKYNAQYNNEIKIKLIIA